MPLPDFDSLPLGSTTDITLKNEKLSTEELQALATAIKQNKVRTLRLHQCCLRDADVAVLTPEIAETSSLKVLDFSNCHDKSAILLALPDGNHINTMNQLYVPSANAISTALSSNSSITELNISDNYGIDDSCMDNLTHAICNNSRMKLALVDVRWTNLSPQPLHDLLRALKFRNPGVKFECTNLIAESTCTETVRDALGCRPF
jgi:hypothetical protein